MSENPVHKIEILQNLLSSALFTEILETHLCGHCFPEWYHNTILKRQM